MLKLIMTRCWMSC